MIQITWRYDPQDEPLGVDPATAEEVRFLLQRGNRAFADLGRGGHTAEYVIGVSAQELGFGDVPGVAPVQTPMAVVLGCADARVPLELVFSQSANDLFAVRVAGNILGSDCVGSMDFAVTRLPSVRLLAVVGHTACGGVQAAVDAYLEPNTYLGLAANLPLRRIVDTIVPAVHSADVALRNHYGPDVGLRAGYREALVDASVVVNAAIAADAMQRIFREHLGERLGAAFGVYDLTSRLVGLPDLQVDWRHGLFPPPPQEQMPQFVDAVVRSLHIRALLG